MDEAILTRRALNRALLVRQLLLERASLTAYEAIEHLVGLQAQIPNPPYIGLWARLADVKRDTLTQLMEERQVVRAALMRSTLHVMTAVDHQRFRPLLQPALARALRAFFGKRAQGLDIDALVAGVRPFLEAAPRTTGELRSRLTEIAPDRDPDALAYALRTFLPLVQVPPGGTWGSGSSARYATAETWLGAFEPADMRTLLWRYLAAFGPASMMDFQAWSGMVKLKGELEPFKAELRVFRDEQGVELLDLPTAPRPPADMPAPVRYIPEYDNLLLSHADRTRVIADGRRSRVFLSAGRVLSTILVDGFVQGTWKIERAKHEATLRVMPFAPIAAPERAALVAEGEQLLRFVEESAETYEVDIADPAEQ